MCPRQESQICYSLAVGQMSTLARQIPAVLGLARKHRINHDEVSSRASHALPDGVRYVDPLLNLCDRSHC